jgi:tryptophan halogenase
MARPSTGPFSAHPAGRLQYRPEIPAYAQYRGNFPYAYHLDAIKLAKRLSEFGQARGIRHKLANITDVKVSPEEQISSLETDQGETLTADLYVDCTGFRSALLGKALDVPMKSYAKYLLCDRAVTMRVPYEVYRPERILTYTLATAREAGWQMGHQPAVPPRYRLCLFQPVSQ